MTTINPDPDSKLGRLCVAYNLAKPRADQAMRSFEQIKDAIKAELANAAPGETRVDLVGEVLDCPLRMTVQQRWYVDTKGMKAADPLTYVKWAKQRTVYDLRAVPTE